MTTPATAAALARLHAAAATVAAGWLPTTWDDLDTGGTIAMRPKLLQESPFGVFDLVLEPDTKTRLRCSLDVPAVVAGVDVVGEPLELTVNSLYPVTASVDGTVALDATGVPAAAGPALVQVVPAVVEGGSGLLTLEIRTPANAVPSIAPHLIPPWVWIHFTTPGLRARFELLDVAWARLLLADRLAATDAEVAAVEEAAAAVPDDLLHAPADDLSRLGALLSPFHERARAVHVDLVGHSHIDLAWLWTWEDTQHVIERDFDSVLSLLDDFPEMRFTHSQPATYEVVRRSRPEVFERVREHVRSGRWEPATAQWVEADMNLISGEAMARQLLEGVIWTREHFDRSPDVLLAPDTFGHAGNVPQLTASGGATAYYHHRCVPGSPAWPAYWWEGDDGSRVLGVSTPVYYGPITAGGVAAAAVRALDAGQPRILALYGVCDHGGGPTRQSLETLRRLVEEAGLPTLRCATIAEHRRDLLATEPDLPVHRGESSITFPGCYTSHCDSKSMNRTAEAALVTAEALAVLAGLGHSDDLVGAWRTALFQQFHDILGGSSIADVYTDQAADTARVLAATDAVTTEALARLWLGVPADQVAVTNPHGWPRTDVVTVPVGDVAEGAVSVRGGDGTVAAGQVDAGLLTFVADVPAFATTSYEVVGSTPVEVGGITTETSDTTITITTPRQVVVIERSTGAVVGLTERRSGIDVLAADGAGLGFLDVVDEAPVSMSAWVVGPAVGEEPAPLATSCEVVECGPVRAVVEVVTAVRSSVVRRRLVVHSAFDRIDVDVDIDWHETGSATAGIPGLKLSCDLRRPAAAWYETPFSAVTRGSGPGEVPALGWAALEDAAGGGLAVVADARHAYDAADGRLRLRLVRSPYEPDPTADHGVHTIRLSFMTFRDGGWRSARLPQVAAGRLTPLLAGRSDGVRGATAASAGWAPSITADDNVVVAALKPARAGTGAVLRLYEATGGPGTAALDGLAPGTGLRRATVVEDPLDDVPVDDAGRALLALGPFEVVTLLVQHT